MPHRLVTNSSCLNFFRGCLGLTIFSLFLFPSIALGAKNFHAEGSDLLMGVGAKAIGLGGAVCAGTKSPYSIYWNPAGLAEINESQISISGQPNAKFLPVNFAGVAFTGEWLHFAGMKSTIGFAWIPRLHVTASGSYAANDFESLFLRFAVPDLPGFNGNIRSKTKDFRLSWALMPENDPQWSFGLTVARINCGTSFCGVKANNPGQYLTESTKATAYAVNVGGKYYYSKDLIFGFNLKDVDTKVDIGIKTTYPNGSVKNSIYKTAFPKDLTIGAFWRYSPDLNLSFDYQTMFGHYGTYKMNFHILRMGVEYMHRSFQYRLGMIAPMRLRAEGIVDYRNKMPVPVIPTMGIGFKGKLINIDAAIYAQPVMSAQRNKPVPALDISVTRKF